MAGLALRAFVRPSTILRMGQALVRSLALVLSHAVNLRRTSLIFGQVRLSISSRRCDNPEIPANPDLMRLDKFLSQNTELTRSQARQAIRRGRVTVSGHRVRDPGAAIAPEADVLWNGRPVAALGPRYYMLHKPVGYVSVTEHDRHPTVLDLLDIEPRRGLHAAGRLDLSASGLVLITDDGDWSHRLTSPRHHCPKTYRVGLAEPVTQAMVEALRVGVVLRGETEQTRPADLEVITPTEVRLTLTEGRYHQVKRMFAAMGNRVTALHRERIGAIALDAELAPGQWRCLTPEEIVRAVAAPADRG